MTHTPTLKSKIDELLEAAEKATPRPWKGDEFEILAPRANALIPGNVRIVLAEDHHMDEWDAEYVIKAANLAPQMARELKNMMDDLFLIEGLSRDKYGSVDAEWFKVNALGIVSKALARAKKELGCG